MLTATSPSTIAALPQRRDIYLAIFVAALGYFVDLYDLILFAIVRVASLTDLGVPKEALLDSGVHLLNLQMAGMLVGGVMWGILGDRKGRLTVLYGSILLYSLANIANGLISDVAWYGLLRFIAGVGLAGELGAGITLVMELMDAESRGWGATIIATVGVLGAVTAGIVGDTFPWRSAYFIGGGLGLVLLIIRIRVRESGLFQRLRGTDISRGNFLMLLQSGPRLARYLAVIAVGLPIWFTAAIIITFCPEFARTLGMTEIPTAGRAVFFYYIGLAIGDFGSGTLSQLLKRRKPIVAGFIGFTAAAVLIYFVTAPTSLNVFYGLCLLLGTANGYWVVFVTMASEQFGTNLRSTVTTSVPNFVRGAVVPITLAFQSLKPSMGLIGSAVAVGIAVGAVALIALWALQETYGRDLDYQET